MCMGVGKKRVYQYIINHTTGVDRSPRRVISAQRVVIKFHSGWALGVINFSRWGYFLPSGWVPIGTVGTNCVGVCRKCGDSFTSDRRLWVSPSHGGYFGRSPPGVISVAFHRRLVPKVCLSHGKYSISWKGGSDGASSRGVIDWYPADYDSSPEVMTLQNIRWLTKLFLDMTCSLWFFLLQDVFFLTNLHNKSSSCWHLCTTSRHFTSNSTLRLIRLFKTALRIDTSSTRPLVDDFCTTTRHFTFNSTQWVIWRREKYTNMRCIPEPFWNERGNPNGPGVHASSLMRSTAWDLTCAPWGCLGFPRTFQNGSGMHHTFAYFSPLQISHWVELNVKWRVVVQKSSTRGRVENVSLHKVVLKKTTCDVELEVKWRVVVQKSSTRGRVEDVSMRKFVKKKTYCGVELDVKWGIVGQRSSTGGRLSAQICQEKRRLVTSN